MDVKNNNLPDGLITDATVVDSSNTQPNVEAIDFKEFAISVMNQLQTIGQLTWTQPEPDNIDKKLEINTVRVLKNGEKQRFRITIENPDALIF